MSHLSLSFADGESSLSVQPFSVFEIVSSLYEVSIVDLSDDAAPSADAVIAQPAQLRIDANLTDAESGPRVWTGICSHIEEVGSTPSGLSTYEVQIVPALWLADVGTDQRLSSKKAAPDVVDSSLSEWELIRAGGETALRIRPTTVRFNTMRRLTLFCIGRPQPRVGRDSGIQERRLNGGAQARVGKQPVASWARAAGANAKPVAPSQLRRPARRAPASHAVMAAALLCGRGPGATDRPL